MKRKYRIYYRLNLAMFAPLEIFSFAFCYGRDATIRDDHTGQHVRVWRVKEIKSKAI